MSNHRACPVCGNVEAPDARFCSRCGEALYGGRDRGRERRAQVSIVFCDLAGSTALGERLDPEILRSVQERYFGSCALALRAHGGQIEKYIGDAVMCVFGLPMAHEDDALRAARAALDLIAAVERLNADLRSDLGIELNVRVGVNTGEVVAGDHSRGQALVTGDAVNVAARLEQAAPAGGILIGALTHRLVAGQVKAEEVAPVQAKGKALPLAAWQLLALADPASSHMVPPTSLVGRGDELEALQAACARVEARRRTEMVLVSGEAGIGKSRLVVEFISRLSTSALTGACPSYGRGNTYRPLRDLIEAAAPSATHAELVALLASQPDAATMATRLLRLIGRESGPVTGAEAFAAVADLIAALAADTPLVVVFEDLHWAEATFVDLLQFLVETVALPVLIVGTTRDDFFDEEHSGLAQRVIRLGRLTDAAAAELLARNDDLDAAEVEDLVARAGGNPLFLEQLAAWRSEGADGTPPDVASLIAARLDTLDLEARLVIEAAAVVGRDFLPAAVERLTAEEPEVILLRGLTSLEARGFVTPGASSASQGPTGLSGVFGGERLHFCHALVFDAVLAAMPKARRAELHECFATDLLQRAGHEAAVVGYHLEQAALLRMALRPRDAVPQVAIAAAAQLEQAGLEALEHGDPPAATVLLSRAHELLPAAAPQRAGLKEALELSRGSPPAADLDELAPGTELGGYVIESTAGRGGMAIVYRAHDRELERPVALKVIAPALAGQFPFRERFARESRIAAGIDHPGVIPVYRAGEDQGRLFIAMRYLRGGDLAQRLRQLGRFAPDDAARCVHAIALALDAAHARGLVHRDVKPANMMLDDADSDVGRVYLTDFGLSSDRLAASELTRTGQWVGTVAYSAPEQVRGASVDARADVYALGGVLHHLLTGQVPYPAASELDALAAHLTEAPPRPSRQAADVPREYDAIIARAMAKDPEERYASAGDLGRAALAAARHVRAPREHGSVATGAAASGAIDPTARPRSIVRARQRRLAIPIGAGMVALAAIAVASITLLTRASSQNPPKNPAGALVGAPILLPAPPDRVTATAAAIWALGTDGAAIERVDVRSRGVRAVAEPFILGGGGGFLDIAADDESVWVVHGSPTLGGIDRVADSKDRAPVHVALNNASAVAVGGGSVWAASNPAGKHLGALVRIDGSKGEVTGRIPRLGRGASEIVVAAGGIWVVLRREGAVARIDSKRLRIVARVQVGARPDRLALAGDSVWVLNSADRTITQIDTRTNVVRGAPISLGKELQDIVAAGGSLWVAASDHTLTRLDAHTGAIIGTPIGVGSPPLALSASANSVWVGSSGDNTVQRVDIT
ncbi:MAG: protein kinase [Actinomycetota bacterium]|nr:protein kinase [Actinomycetota bacterium]